MHSGSSYSKLNLPALHMQNVVVVGLGCMSRTLFLAFLVSKLTSLSVFAAAVPIILLDYGLYYIHICLIGWYEHIYIYIYTYIYVMPKAAGNQILISNQITCTTFIDNIINCISKYEIM